MHNRHMDRQTRSGGRRGATFTVRGLVLQARGTRTQKDFAAVLGVDQASVCKYEKGTVDPPARVVELCMALLEDSEQKRGLSAGDIAQRVRTELSGDEYAPIRTAFSYVIDTVRRRR